jgi:hypothetical protein
MHRSVQCCAALVALASLAGGAGCVVRVESQAYTAREEKRFRVDGQPEVTLATFDGPIEVRAWDRPEVLIEIEKSAAAKEVADRIRVLAEQEGNRIRVEARQPDSSEWIFGVMVNNQRQAKLVASVPRSCSLFARTGDGSISVERVSGRIELRSGDGSIRGLDLDGEIAIDTGDGSIKLDNVNGAVDLRSGDGTIVADGKLAVVNASTSDGSIHLRVAPGSTLARDWEVTTGDGAIVVALPDQLDAELDAQTGDGSVRMDTTLESATIEKIASAGAADDDSERRILRAKVGAGGPLIRIRTGDGSINLKRY